MPYGGWVPKGREAKDGRIPDTFLGLTETETDDKDHRTYLNVGSSDATLIVTDGSISHGTALTERVAKQLDKPLLIADLRTDNHELIKQINSWLVENDPAVLNVAGPREDEAEGIGKAAEALLESTLEVGSTRHDEALANLRHWDTVRWIVPFWYLSAVAATMVGLANAKAGILVYGYANLVLGIVGIFCAQLIFNTIQYHNDQRRRVSKASEKARDNTLLELEISLSQPHLRASVSFLYLTIFVAGMLLGSGLELTTRDLRS